MSISAPTLSRLCGDVDTFIADTWERQPALRRSGDFSDLFSLGAADMLLGAGALQVPNYVRLSRVEPTISDWEKHCRWMDSALGHPTPFLDVDAAIREYDAGRTIIFHSLRDRVPELDEFAHRIEDEIGHRVTVDAFVTPPHSECWEPHYDIANLFVLQIYGVKEWALWEPTVQLPVPTYCPDQSGATGEARHVTLREGDALYVPRGHPHAASTGAVPSIHVTVSINTTTWRDALRRLLGPLHVHASMRASLPVGYNNDPSLLVDGTAATLDHLASMLAAIDAEPAAATLAARSVATRQTSLGRLTQALGATRPASRGSDLGTS